jgi:hypothetical protein
VDKENKQSADKEYEVWLGKDPHNDSTIPPNTSDTFNKQSKKIRHRSLRMIFRNLSKKLLP